MITIGIKALNEERNIAMSIESALTAASPFGGRVVLADSGSTDNTIQIASRYPIDIVQLADFSERCCGAGAQLAFQAAIGEYFYILDGDMTLDPGFLSAGVTYLKNNPEAAAVGGQVEERNLSGQDFQIRNASMGSSNWKPGRVDRLDCGGLYRTEAVRQLHYFGDKNLHSFEEFDLGARLEAKGWTLSRIAVPAVVHFGHQVDGYALLMRRLKSGYAGGGGEVLRAALGKAHLPIVLRQLKHLTVFLLIYIWWIVMAKLLLEWSPLAFVAIVVPLLYLSWRRRSVKLGVYSFASWNIGALGSIAGVFRRRSSPEIPIKTVVIKRSDSISPDHYQGLISKE